MDQDSANTQPLTRLLDSVTDELAKLSADEAHLTVRALHDGLWIAPDVTDFKGGWLPRGTNLGLLADPAAFEFDATVTEDDARSLFGKSLHRASVRLVGQSADKLTVTHWRVIPGGQSILPSPSLAGATLISVIGKMNTVVRFQDDHRSITSFITGSIAS